MDTYKSVFGDEINQYLQLQLAAGRKIRNLQIVLGRLDTFLCSQCVHVKNLDEDTVNHWITTIGGTATNRESYISRFRGFARYLQSLGIRVFLPELPRVVSDYAPYVFSDQEWRTFIVHADNLPNSKDNAYSAVAFSLLLRILYGCGLRLGEAMALQLKDIDLSGGTLFIRHAKNEKQRIVPMHKSLTDFIMVCLKTFSLPHDAEYYLFTNPNTGMSFSRGWARKRMKHMLDAAGIEYARSRPHERGPCLHCFRHTFVVRSFIQLTETIPSFEDAVPFVSVYLGHCDIMETDKYLQGSYELYSKDRHRINEYVQKNNIFPEVIDE